MVPPSLGPYRPLARLATGGVAEVLLAAPLAQPSRRVALKRPLPHLAADPALRLAFTEEARVTRLPHGPRVVPLLDLLDLQGVPVLVLAYVHGVPLAALLDAHARVGRTLPPDLALRILLDLLDGLTSLHEPPAPTPSLVHGDLTPFNVIVAEDGASTLCDLGLAAPPRAPRPGLFQGTAAYAAPEVWQGTAQSHRSDLFSVGVLLWESLRGQRLFRGDSELATLQNLLEAPIPALDHDRPELSPLAPVVQACLERTPALRPASAASLRRDLAAAHPVAAHAAVGALVRQCYGRTLDARHALR